MYLRLITAILLLTFPHVTFAKECPPGRSQFEDAAALYTEVAIVGTDDRQNRSPESFGEKVEAAQGRFWCHVQGTRPGKDQVPTKSELRANYSAANATLAFEDDMAIINRHNFVDEKGKLIRKPENCFFEHIQSGEIIKVADAEYSKKDLGGPFILDQNEDIALVKLSKKLPKGSALRKDDMLISGAHDLPLEQPVKVVSNYAANHPSGNKETLTMTTCVRMGRYSHKGAELNAYGTTCDTGKGSSGAQAYIDSGGPKLFGIVTGDFIKKEEGGDFDPKKLSTIITTFDQSLLDKYEALRSRQEI